MMQHVSRSLAENQTHIRWANCTRCAGEMLRCHVASIKNMWLALSFLTLLLCVQRLPQKIAGGASVIDKTMTMTMTMTMTKHAPDVASSTWTHNSSGTARPATAAAGGGAGSGTVTMHRVAPCTQPPPQRVGGVGSVCDGGPMLASKPPRVGLSKNMLSRSSIPLHRLVERGSAAPAARGARPGGQGGGVKIVGGQMGVRRPGLQKNVVVRQQLHMRLEF